MSQQLLFSGPQAEFQMVYRRLKNAFGRILDEDRPDPMRQLVLSLIGIRTYDHIALRVFWRFLLHYRNWDALAEAPEEEIEALLAGVRFPDKKAQALKFGLRKIRARVGAIDLEFLADLPVETALLWLEDIDGVGRKVSAATLNFSTLRKRAFVVDTHVWRVMRRFGLVGPQAKTIDVYDAVMELTAEFDADDLYELHWLLKRLGQNICTHGRAHCASCPISAICMKRVEDRGGNTLLGYEKRTA